MNAVSDSIPQRWLYQKHPGQTTERLPAALVNGDQRMPHPHFTQPSHSPGQPGRVSPVQAFQPLSLRSGARLRASSAGRAQPLSSGYPGPPCQTQPGTSEDTRKRKRAAPPQLAHLCLWAGEGPGTRKPEASAQPSSSALSSQVQANTARLPAQLRPARGPRGPLAAGPPPLLPLPVRCPARRRARCSQLQGACLGK